MDAFTYRDMTAHLGPRKKFRGWESPASRNSTCHGASCRGVGMSSLNCQCPEKFLKKYLCTCEEVHPPTGSPPLSAAHRIITTALMPPDIAPWRAPLERTWGLCCRRPSSWFNLAGFLLKRHLTVGRTVSGWTKLSSEGGAFSCTACAKSAGGELDCVVWVTAVDDRRLVVESEDIVKEINCTGIFITWE